MAQLLDRSGERYVSSDTPMTDVEFIRNEARVMETDCRPDLARRSRAIAGRLKVLEAIVAKLPKNADDSPITIGDTIWLPAGTRYVSGAAHMQAGGVLEGVVVKISESYVWFETKAGMTGHVQAAWCYSTLEAAEAASKQEAA